MLGNQARGKWGRQPTLHMQKQDAGSASGNAQRNPKPSKTTEKTPLTNPENFVPVRGTKAKLNRETGEIWFPDMLHKDHYEVYKNRKHFDKGKRHRSVWHDGRLKEILK